VFVFFLWEVSCVCVGIGCFFGLGFFYFVFGLLFFVVFIVWLLLCVVVLFGCRVFDWFWCWWLWDYWGWFFFGFYLRFCFLFLGGVWLFMVGGWVRFFVGGGFWVGFVFFFGW